MIVNITKIELWWLNKEEEETDELVSFSNVVLWGGVEQGGLISNCLRPQ